MSLEIGNSRICGDASQYLEVSRLFEQRMDIMTSILDTTKQVLTVRRKTQK